MTTPQRQQSVTIRRKVENVRAAVKTLAKQAGLSEVDQLNISNMYRMIEQIDARHRAALKLSGHAVIPLHRKALAADCLDSAERNALKANLTGGHHDPAA